MTPQPDRWRLLVSYEEAQVLRLALRFIDPHLTFREAIAARDLEDRLAAVGPVLMGLVAS